jgi:spermidine/putrescine-binding protein
MKRRTFLMGAAAAAAACSRGPRLNIFNWSDYVAPDTISNFEREFGLRVRYGTYESIPEMLAKVMSGNSGWDVIFPSAEYIQPMRDMGLLAPVRHRNRLSDQPRMDAACLVGLVGRSPHG